MGEVRRIMQVCACLWGGAFNPIIPVCEETPEPWSEPPFPSPAGSEVTRGYLDFFEPDFFVESETGLAARAGVADLELTYGEPRVLSLDAFFDPPEPRRSGHPRVPFGLTVFDVYQELYNRQFQFVRRHDSRVVAFDSSPEHDAFIEAAFGGFPSRGYLSSLANAYREAFDSLQLQATAEAWTRIAKESYATPLRFTMHTIKRDPDGHGDPIFFIADPKSPLDLIDLWNLRQFAEPVLPISSPWLTEARDSIREFVTANYRPLPGNPHGVMVHTTIQFGRSFSDERARELALSLLDGLPPGSWTYHRWYQGIWHVDRTQDRVMQPRRARLSAAESDIESPVDGQKERSIRFRSLAPGFASLYGGDKARWVNVLRLHTYAIDESLAVVLPSDTPQQTVARMRLGGEGAIVSREGLTLPQHFKNHLEFVHLLPGAQLVGEYFEAHGWTAKPSDAGRIADQVLKSIGGLSRAALFAHRETLQTLDKMAKSVRQFSDGTTEQYPDRAMPAKLWQDLIAKRNGQKRWLGDFALDAFVKAGLLRLGLSLQCPNCLNHNWCGLPELDEQVVCERCLEKFDFPQGSLNFERTPWQFRVVGPFAVPNYAGGAYGTVLALRAFSENLGGDAQITYSTGLDILVGPEKKYEIDFAFWHRRRHSFGSDEEPALAFGEAKSFAEESFKTRDIERMEALGKAFPGAFLIFATMKDALSEDEKTAIGKLALWGREVLKTGQPRNPVIVLTGAEMFSEWHIQHSWENLGGRHKEFASRGYIGFDNLWDFADLTQQLYLGLADKWAEIRAKTTVNAESNPPRPS
jgi:hypothetical protein